MAPTTGVDPVWTPAALALRIHSFAFHLQVTVLFWAIYQVQFPHTNPRDFQVYFTIYRSLSHVFGEMVTGDFSLILASFESRTCVAAFAIGALAGIASVFHATGTVRFIAPGIIRSIPIFILAASLRVFTETISAELIWYLAAIAEMVSPETTVWTTPEIGGILRI